MAEEDLMTEGAPSIPGPENVPEGTGAFGMVLFLVSLGMLFGASLIGYGAVRLRAASWPPPGTPNLPSGLWISTLIILYSSVTIQWALRSARRGAQVSLRKSLLWTSLLGFAFLVCQIVSWMSLVAARVTIQSNLYAFTYYILTGLHALHVIGGLIPLLIVTRKAYQGAYSRYEHDAIQYCAMYWHFLDAVWIIMFSVIFLTL